MSTDQTCFEVGVPVGSIVDEILVVGPVEHFNPSAADLETIQSAIESVEPIHGIGEAGEAVEAWSDGVLECWSVGVLECWTVKEAGRQLGVLRQGL